MTPVCGAEFTGQSGGERRKRSFRTLPYPSVRGQADGGLQSTVHGPRSKVHGPKWEVHSPRSTVHSPQSEGRSPKSKVQSPTSTVRTGNVAARGVSAAVEHKTPFVSEARLVRLTSPEWVIVAVRRIFGLWRRAGGIIVPLLILEARNEKNPSGGTIFSASFASGYWSMEYFCRFFHEIWISAEAFAARNSVRRRARRLRRLAMVWTLIFSFRASAFGRVMPEWSRPRSFLRRRSLPRYWSN